MARKSASTGKARVKASAGDSSPKAPSQKKAGSGSRTISKGPTQASPTNTASKSAREVRVRMYRQGLGDCFLLTFPKPEGGEFFILIDCGVILGTPDPVPLMRKVVEDIVATTGNHIDILVATHEHWDHLSGFDQVKEIFDSMNVDTVWLAWTEDPRNETAQQLRRDRAQRLAALWFGVGQMQARLPASADSAETVQARESLDRAAEVLSFFGIDPIEDRPPSDGLGAVEKATSKTGAAMKWVREKTASPRFCTPGDTIPLPEAGGVRAYVLGPPTDLVQLRKDLPTSSGKEIYEASMALAALVTSLGADPVDVGERPSPEFDASMPFDQKYRVPEKDARNMEFYQEHYYGTGPDDSDADWRRIDSSWAGSATDFALQLDSDTNNTSLALAVELPSGDVLLFPGDAQVGNWESWHADSKGKDLIWQVDGRDVRASQLLSRTVLYKVGHHGSHNATLREKGLEMMTDPRLTAMIPVDTHIAHDKKRWMKMPFAPLVARLHEKTQGRVVQVDGETKEITNPVRIEDSGSLIEVSGMGDQTVKRPLYVDFFVPY